MSYNPDHDRALLAACLMTIIEVEQQLEAAKQSHKKIVTLLSERLTASPKADAPQKAQVVQLRQ